MADPRSDHLIERAAARLTSGTLTPPEPPSPVPARIDGPVPFPSTEATRTPGPTGPVAGAISGAGAGQGAVPSAPSAVEAQPPAVTGVALAEMEASGLVVGRAARTRISEEYRIVVGRIMRATWGEGEADGLRNLLMVTSARPGEGKSFTALNLAGSIAGTGSDRVLLVDADSKPRSVSLQLGLAGRRGFLDLVADPKLSPASVVLPTAIPNLSILPIGTRRTEEPGSGSPSITPTIERLGRTYSNHLVILDAPPCLSTSDPHTIAAHVGQVVMVVEAERTQRAEVEAALDLVRVCPNITVLLNKVKLTSSNTFGAYDYYGSYT